MPKKYVKSTTYSPVLDDYVYCTINRALVKERDYGNELRLLRSIHGANEFLKGNIASLN